MNKSTDFEPFLKVAEQAAHQAGELLVSKMGQVGVDEKNPGDFVTEADIASQEAIHKIILDAFPDHEFLGEESDHQDQAQKLARAEYCWIVDPLDGTTNFIHQLRSFSVSIALKHKQQIIAGCIHDPLLNETYSATLGGGAFLNGEPIQPRSSSGLKDCIIVCSLPSRLNRDSLELQQLVNVLCDSQATVRRLGSAALNLCYIACGRLDAYWSTFAKIWDIAAGFLILQEAGGVFMNIDGGKFDFEDIRFIASSNPTVGAELERCLNQLNGESYQ